MKDYSRTDHVDAWLDRLEKANSGGEDIGGLEINDLISMCRHYKAMFEYLADRIEDDKGTYDE